MLLKAKGKGARQAGIKQRAWEGMHASEGASAVECLLAWWKGRWGKGVAVWWLGAGSGARVAGRKKGRDRQCMELEKTLRDAHLFPTRGSEFMPLP